ncbi:ROK family transcriptional regulator [Occultella kanbiaonis]|uniref:ROK family transcriptional regulator n=1 Tax=Occultella kanbiaonis TaxID=2675754 RepID=UPI0013D72C11|nr:ROK family transcriptional regulator [Occultella kanbiaonis]
MLNSNLKRALATLVTRGGMHRADLARQIGIARTTSTNIVNSLLESGLVRGEFETAPPPAGEVRLKEKLSVSPRAGQLVSIVTLTRRTIVAIGSLDGTILGQESWAEPVDRLGVLRLADAVGAVQRLHAQVSVDDSPLRSALLAVNVQTDRQTGEALSYDRDSVWLRANPAKTVAGLLDVPIVLENAARLQGLAAYFHDANRDAHNLIYLHLSHGVGLSFVVDGRTVTGSRGGGGEIGHMVVDPSGPACWCGKYGCLTNYVSLPALAAMEGVRVESLTAQSPGEPPQHRLSPTTVAEAGVRAGRALGEVCNLIEPDVVVVGGELSRYGDALLVPLAAEARRTSLPLVSRDLKVAQGQCFDDPEALSSAAFARIVQSDDLIEHLVDAIADHL